MLPVALELGLVVSNPRVAPFTFEELKSNLAYEKPNSARHLDYLYKYLTDLGAKTIVVECNYIDRDFLDDYANYYSRCFSPPYRKCSRLHFFNERFVQSNFESIILGEAKPDPLTLSYLGFIVVRPLPITKIGKTCLKTLFADGQEGYSPAVQSYAVSLYGIKLNVKSLAFQEQDNVAAACATSALWMLFHRTSNIYGHNIPSPLEITRQATARLPLGDRIFPNAGLRKEQMAEAIKEVGLEPFEKSADPRIFSIMLYAYLRGGTPALLHVIDQSDNQPHVVLASGYALTGKRPIPFPKSNILYRATRMQGLLVHDDQIGPYARFNICAPIRVRYMEHGKLRSGRLPLLTSKWEGHGNKLVGVDFIAQTILLALYHKIRIPFLTASSYVNTLDGAMRPIAKRFKVRCFEWDVYLTTVNDLKEELRSDEHITKEQKSRLLFMEMPRFVWRATAISDGVPVCYIFMDATGIEQEDLAFCTAAINGEFCRLLNRPAISKIVKGKPAAPILNRLSNTTSGDGVWVHSIEQPLPPAAKKRRQRKYSETA